MTPHIKRSSPPYVQISDHYRDLIAHGALSEGDRLPTVTDLAAEFSVSPGTAHKAVRQLRGEGLVRTTQQGTTVLGRRAVPAPVERVQQSRVPVHDLVDVNEAGMVPMLPNVGAALGINADALNMRVARRQTVAYREGEPYQLSVSWFPAHLTSSVPELLEPHPIEDILRLIGERTDRTATYGRGHYESRTADARESGALHLREGAAVLAGASVWSDVTGPIQYYEFVLPSHHAVTNEYSLKRP